ncbi:threonine--tRNA ligase [Wolbachia pipientis]|uniref:Threonine--tRNA ligase n=1 Tax=Wolbachia pipientis TaxID=955 RepID=A0A6H2NUB8_WOLPI|nr:threonine--tRNA ligase [Wolbachia endosymbiont of Aedes albopictus]TVS91321.1 threonine--tRNA ligase [Wolbachia pipientis]TVS95200.1 threonine--tRNA ligase [Wolbachia pipientis]UVW83495.1 threonine--tRNA ligase [Wolbachia endosymbiont of Aedes albopictus]
MIKVTFSTEQKVKEYSGIVTSFDILQPDALKEAVALKVNGELYDLSREIESDAEIEVIQLSDEAGLDIIRHDAAHIMAQAVKELFPNTQITIGPTIQDGFYYDFATSRAFTTDDLTTIEKKMKEIVKSNHRFVREVWTRKQAIDFFSGIGEKYKVDIISSIPESENLTVYRQGDFVDLCRGPHSPSTSRVKAFKLMKVAGAYWRGDAKGPILQRIYGTAWRNQDELNAYLECLKEAEKRDHRKIAKDMDLFHIQEEAVGQVFWHEQGYILYNVLESYIRKKLINNGYFEVKTPILVGKELWERSGHWDKFRESMFTVDESESKKLAIKPMNCPCHVQVFNSLTRSYRDLPIRMAEFGTCHRNESSGSLHGLMRVRGFTQDDAHIFCMEEQANSETIKFCDLLKEVYSELGFNEISVKFSDRPDIRAGNDEVWDRAEKALLEAVKEAGLSYKLNPGEGAFYGPKLEFFLKDAIGRNWQCGTLQVDFILPERLGAFYIGADGHKHHPVMLHRAILGTFERFIGILIENYAGKFPVWLAPTQLAILTITNEADGYATEISNILKEQGVRVKTDLTNEKISYKIRLHSSNKTPILWIVGKNEVTSKTVSVRNLGSERQESFSLEKANESLLKSINLN